MRKLMEEYGQKDTMKDTKKELKRELKRGMLKEQIMKNGK